MKLSLSILYPNLELPSKNWSIGLNVMRKMIGERLECIHNMEETPKQRVEPCFGVETVRMIQTNWFYGEEKSSGRDEN